MLIVFDMRFMYNKYRSLLSIAYANDDNMYNQLRSTLLLQSTTD